MARPKKCRRVCALPAIKEFVPDSCRNAADCIVLAVDEYEAIRLIDYEGFSKEECGEHMSVARTTVQQIYTSARKKIAEALVEGCALVIEGGDYRLCEGRGSHCRRTICVRDNQEPARPADKGGNKMRIAVTYENGQIFQHFGHTETFKIYDVEDRNVTMSAVVNTEGSGHGALAGMLKQLNVDVLICGGIGGGAQMALAQAGIRLFGGVSGEADAAVEAFLNGGLNYNPDVKCSHHGEHHHEDHQCGDHGCGGHCGD